MQTADAHPGQTPRRTTAEAIAELDRRFPIPGYVAALEDACRGIAEVLRRHVEPGEAVLDFGAGRCAKAGLAQLLGYRCVAYDDLGDPSIRGGDRAEIVAFAEAVGVELHVGPYGVELPFAPGSFALVMLHDVLEHLPHSPRELLNELLALVEDGGHLFVTVPNAVNLRKRLDVLRGRTNLPPYDAFFWQPPPWRGHVREYTRDDLDRLCRHLALEPVELFSTHHMLAKLPRAARPAYRAATRLAPGWRDTWVLVARKPPGWTPAVEPPASVDLDLGRIGHWGR